MTDSSDEQLLEAVKDALTKNGQLDKFKGEMRAAVMSVLNKTPVDRKPPDIPSETLLLNELVKEFLDWNGYRYTGQVLVAESGQDSQITRENLAGKLGVLDDNRTLKIPLLYYVLAEFQKKE